MNTETFTRLLEALTPADWQAVIDGASLVMEDDLRIVTGPGNSPNAITAAEEGQADPSALRDEVLDAAEVLLTNYYLGHFLSLKGFRAQASKLLEAHGAPAFAAAPGQAPARTLFVDGGEVVAEGPESPRHRYGAYCELDVPLNETLASERVRRWVESGEAHERYLGMNVCRNNC